MNTIIILLLVLLPFCFSCDHDNLNFTVDVIPSTDPIQPLQGRRLEVSERDNIRIAAFYYLDNAAPEVASMIKDQVVPAAIAYYQATLKVNRVNNLWIDPLVSTRCGSVVPPDVLATGIPFDLVLFIMGNFNESSSSGASSRPCVLMSPTERPILGLISYNFAGWDNTSALDYENKIYTTLHEMGHVLGLTPSLFDNFKDPATGETIPYPSKEVTVNGVLTNMLVLPPLAQRLQSYFNCPTIEGAYLENQGQSGSIGSHFERRIFFNEFMTATGKENRRVSEFFLAILEGSGWYTPNYSMAEPMFWGKGKGCAFLNEPCISTSNGQTTTKFPDHYCTQLEQSSCTFSGQSIGFCGTTDYEGTDNTLNPAFNYWGNWTDVIDSFADNCPYYYGYSNLDCQDPSDYKNRNIDAEIFSSKSYCFPGTLKEKSAAKSRRHYCFHQTCEASGSGYKVLVQVGNQTVTCSKAGDVTVKYYKGVLSCPDPNEFCTTKALQFCPRGCMGRGTCVNNACVCNEGYDGDSCSYRTGLFPPEGEVPKSTPTFFFHPLAIPIGAGIIVVVVIIGLIVNKVDELRRRNARANQYAKPPKQNLDHESALRQELQFNFMRSESRKDDFEGEELVMMNVPNRNQGGQRNIPIRNQQMSSTEAYRQQALRFESRQEQYNPSAQEDALAAIRGGRTKK